MVRSSIGRARRQEAEIRVRVPAAIPSPYRPIMGGRCKQRCERTGKVRYRTELDAKIVLGIGLRSLPTRPTRVYECEFCADWHLTSQPKRGKATGPSSSGGRAPR